MLFKTTLTAASIVLLGTAALLAMPAPSEAKDGCGRAYRWSNSKQRCVRRTDVGPRLVQPAVNTCGVPPYALSGLLIVESISCLIEPHPSCGVFM